MKSAPSVSRRQVIAVAGGAALGAAPALLFPAIAQGRTQDLRIGIWGGDFGNLSPAIRYTVPAALVVNHLFDGLVRVDYAKRVLIPWLAESWSNPDPLTWRIKLRENVQWHGGYGEFTAEDVIYTWRHHLDTKSYLVGSALFPLESFVADGKYVLEVKTKTPFGAFPGVTMGYGGLMVSKAAHTEMGNQQYAATPIGHGPYALDFARGNEVGLVRHEKYWRPGFPKLARLNYRAIPDSTVRLQSLEAGEFDFISHPDPKDVSRVRANPMYKVRSVPGWNWDFQQFNLRNPAPNAPYLNKLARQAISYAIDRTAIVDEIYSGEARPTDNQFPAGFLGHQRPLLNYPARGDLVRARALIAQSGLRGYEVEVVTSDKDWLRRELELVAAMVSQVGINFRIRNLDEGGFNNLWFNKTFHQLLEDITLVAPDPDATSWWFLHSGGSTSAYADSKMDAALDAARQARDPAQRTSAYEGIAALTADECPLIYHCNVNLIRIFNAKLAGVPPSLQENIEMFDEAYWT